MELEGYNVSMGHFVGVNNPNANAAQVQKQTEDYLAWLRENANATPFGTSEVIQSGSRAVDDARCVSLWNGPGTVKVIIAGEGMHPADTETLQQCEDYLEVVRPIGAQITVASVASVMVDISATVVLEIGYTLQTVTAAFSAAVQVNFRDQGFSADYLSHAKVGAFAAFGGWGP